MPVERTKAGGKTITIELNDELATFAHSLFCRAGAETKITQLTGKAQEIIPGLDQMFDLVFIDADKREYVEYYSLIIDKVKPGGFILADNVLWGGKVLDHETNDPQAQGIIDFNKMIRNETRIEDVIIPIRDGLMLIRKKDKDKVNGLRGKQRYVMTVAPLCLSALCLLIWYNFWLTEKTLYEKNIIYLFL